MGEYTLAIIGVIGIPVYIYVIVRITTSAVFRSYFEIKREFSNPKKEAA